MIHPQKYIYMSKFYRLQGLQGYLLCIVRLPQVKKIVHKQRNKAMPKFYRLQHCKNELIKITKFVTVTNCQIDNSLFKPINNSQIENNSFHFNKP